MKIISLFSGCGGLDLGLIKSGHSVVWANDIFAKAVATYRANIGDHILEDDITNVKVEEIPDADIVVGGFPCQGFSIANMNRNIDDPRNKLYRQFLRVLRGKKPSFFLAENVKGILSLEGGEVFQRILREFEKCGYSVRYALINSADYGLPQTRHRVFVFGIRHDLKIEVPFPPPTTHAKNADVCPGKLPWVSVGKALAGLPEPGSATPLKNHVCSTYKIKNNGYINHRPVDPNKPAPTVTARGDTKGGAMINHHPSNTRRMSVRETAIIQGFPNSFEFVGSMTDCYMQIGNAVPPIVGFNMGKVLTLAEQQLSDFLVKR